MLLLFIHTFFITTSLSTDDLVLVSAISAAAAALSAIGGIVVAVIFNAISTRQKRKELALTATRDKQMDNRNLVDEMKTIADSYQRQSEEFKAQADALKEQLDTSHTHISNLEAQLTSLQNNVLSLKTQILALTEVINKQHIQMLDTLKVNEQLLAHNAALQQARVSSVLTTTTTTQQ